jgi:NAD(P)-dependent dehydrogenase (short-subunit alcohol dehydrogenase family)
MRARDFDRKTVYVVGGSTGIGLAVAARMAGLGADVLVFARRREPLERAVAELAPRRTRADQRVAHRQLDVADPQAVAAVMAEAVADFGVPDVLVNCAGRSTPRYFEDVSYEQFAETLRVNLHGCWNTVSALVPHMKARGGYIVNTSSLAGLIGVFGFTDYCASKFALVGFSEALRSELKRYGITVSVLCPPDTDTPGFATENLTKPAETRALSGRASLLGPDDVARALLAGMARRAPVIVAGFDAKLAALAKRLAPWLVEWISDREIRRAGTKRP